MIDFPAEPPKWAFALFYHMRLTPPVRLQLLPQLIPRHAEGGVVRAGEDAAYLAPVGGANDRGAEVAGGGGVLQGVAFGERMHVNVAVGAVGRAQAAADAVALDLDLLALAVAVDRIDRAAHQAVRIGARTATAGHQPLVDPQTVANQPRDALMRVAAGLGALVAARAGLQVQNQQALSVVEALFDE